LHLNVIDFGARDDSVLQQLQIDSVTSYCWVHNTGFNSFPLSDFGTIANNSYAYWDAARQKYKRAYIPNVSMGWDPSPRTEQTDTWSDSGYPYTAVFASTPAQFQNSLQVAKNYLDTHCGPTWCALTINAWNEWTEGSYLEPDTENNMAHLQAVGKVFGNSLSTINNQTP